MSSALLEQVLAALAGGPTQNNRLVKLHTPLGPDMLVAERARIIEAIAPAPCAPGVWARGVPARGPDDSHGHDRSRALNVEGVATGLRIEITALAASAHLELKRLIGQPALVELLTQESRWMLRPFHGHITQATLLGGDGGLARYRLVIEPWLAFLAHRQDSWVFQRRTVPQILDELFADYAGQGRLAPSWRWELADAQAYAERSLCIQYQETDLAFVQRLLLEEGLFHWWEHEGDTLGEGLGRHTLVIADHNGAMRPNAHAVVRFTGSDASLGADSLDRWRGTSAVQAAQMGQASWDYRGMGLRPQAAVGVGVGVGENLSQELAIQDIPGIYAYEDGAQGERLTQRRMQALDAARSRVQGAGRWRQAAAGTSFMLVDHAVHAGLDPAGDEFAVLAVEHFVRNNVAAGLQAQVERVVGASALKGLRGLPTTGGWTSLAGADGLQRDSEGNEGRTAVSLPNESTEPVYHCRLVAQPLSVPVRMARVDADGVVDPRSHLSATVHGVQTALVVGNGQPVHTDRDHRIKVQFHWQRGSSSSHRLDHPAGSNAPADDGSGTWVRVSQTVAGDNWGHVFVPRVGQEVVVAFAQGDIDRPVVVGAVHNGQGQVDAQGNARGGGAAGSVGDAPQWFAGQACSGRHEGHGHAAVLAGYKSQALGSSSSGMGGFNQFVVDDSPGANRIELSTSTADTRLQLGLLLNQKDNLRLQPRGHGVDLATSAWGAVRAGSGVLLSAHGKTGSTGGGSSLDTREPVTQLQQGQALLHALAETAQQHKAKGPDEPDVVGAKAEESARQLANERGHYASVDAWQQMQGGDASEAEADGGIGGGHGRNVAWGRPDLVVAAPGGVASFTPAHAVYGAGSTVTLAAGQDLQQLAQRNGSMVSKGALTLFTYGKASNASKPNTETGIRLHAGTGSVSARALSGAMHATADKAVEVASTHAAVTVGSPEHVLLTAGGAAIRMAGGDITITAPGNVEFRAAAKELASSASSGSSIDLPPASKYKDCSVASGQSSASGSAI